LTLNFGWKFCWLWSCPFICYSWFRDCHTWDSYLIKNW